jgi:hypothetical protein
MLVSNCIQIYNKNYTFNVVWLHKYNECRIKCYFSVYKVSDVIIITIPTKILQRITTIQTTCNQIPFKNVTWSHIKTDMWPESFVSNLIIFHWLQNKTGTLIKMIFNQFVTDQHKDTHMPLHTYSLKIGMLSIL